MRASYRTDFITAGATAAQTLAEPAVLVLEVATLDPAAANPNILTNYTIVTGAPAAGQVQFTGTPSAPSNTITFSAALTAGQQVLVRYVPAGALPAAA